MSLTDLAKELGVSLTTIRRWRGRQDGDTQSRSHARKSSPQMPDDLKTLLLTLQKIGGLTGDELWRASQKFGTFGRSYIYKHLMKNPAKTPYFQHDALVISRYRNAFVSYYHPRKEVRLFSTPFDLSAHAFGNYADFTVIATNYKQNKKSLDTWKMSAIVKDAKVMVIDLRNFT